MTGHHNTYEEREMMKLFQQIPVEEEEAKRWIDQIRNEGMVEELGEEIRKRIAELAEDKIVQTKRLQITREFSHLVQRWRLSQQGRGFNKH